MVDYSSARKRTVYRFPLSAQTRRLFRKIDFRDFFLISLAFFRKACYTNRKFNSSVKKGWESNFPVFRLCRGSLARTPVPRWKG